MKILHVSKTSDGSRWAAIQARELVKQGFDVHAALPDAGGSITPVWKAAGCKLHFLACDFPLRKPFTLPDVFRNVRRLVDELKPDLIHIHHAGPAVLMRLALGKHHATPRIFQVPGPLHVEHAVYRNVEINTAGPRDYWIGASAYITRLYAAAGIPSNRVFLSYHGHDVEHYARSRNNILRSHLGIGANRIVIGNINYIYPPKYHVGQTIGLKCHEDVIDALGIVTRERLDVVGVLVGGAWGTKSTHYETKLRQRASRVGRGRIHMPGHLPLETVKRTWPDFDLAIHVPLSENCGGVVEPLLAGVPVIASKIGGLPEVVIPNLTGQLVRARRPDELAQAIFDALDHYGRSKLLAAAGQQLIDHMFDVRRTAAEIANIYKYVLDPHAPAPARFDSKQFLEQTLAVPSIEETAQNGRGIGQAARIT